MVYPTPFVFDIVKGYPLLILACSSVKRPTVAGSLVRFSDLYDGPMWRQVKSSGYPLSNVAAISALHGFLEPGMAIETYDIEMDEDRCKRICSESCHIHRLSKAVHAAGSAFIVGGALYREVGHAAIRRDPDLEGIISFSSGSYLKQRKQLGEWLYEAADLSKVA